MPHTLRGRSAWWTRRNVALRADAAPGLPGTSHVRSTLVKDIGVALRARPARVDGIAYERGRKPRE